MHHHPLVKERALLTMNNVLNIFKAGLSQNVPGFGVAGLILLAVTDLSIGRMVGMGITVATIIMHQGINTVHLWADL